MKFAYFILVLAFVFIVISEASDKALSSPKFYKHLAALHNPLTNERTLIDLGNQLVEAREYEFALELFDKAIDKNPTETSYYDHRAICYSKMSPEYLDMAWSEFKKTIDSGGKSSVLNAVAFENLGIKLYMEKKFNEAHWCYSEALKCDNSNQEEKEEPTKGSNYLMRGICSLMMEDFEAAKTDLKEAAALLDLSSSKEDQTRLREALHEFGRWEDVIKNFFVILDDDELEKLGKMFQDSEKFDEAIHCYTEGITRNSENSMDLYKKRAECHLGMKNIDSAILDYKIRLKTDLHDIGYWYDLILALISHGRIEDAINEIQVMDEMEIRWLARKFLVAEKYENALHIYDEIVRKYSSNSQSYTARAECHLKMGNLNKEILDHKKAVEFEPNLRSSYVERLILYELFEAALKEINFIEEPEKLFGIGNLFFREDRLNETIECCNKAIKNYTSIPSAYHNDYFSEGLRILMELRFSQIIFAKNPNNFNFYYRRGLSHLKLKNFDEAISNFKESLRRLPDDYWSSVYLSEALTEVQDYDKAEEALKGITSKKKIPKDSTNHVYYVERKLKNLKPREQRKKQQKSKNYQTGTAQDAQLQRDLEALLMEVSIP